MLKYKDACASMVNADVNRSKHKDGGDVRKKRAVGGPLNEISAALQQQQRPTGIFSGSTAVPALPSLALKKGGKACKK